SDELINRTGLHETSSEFRSPLPPAHEGLEVLFKQVVRLPGSELIKILRKLKQRADSLFRSEVLRFPPRKDPRITEYGPSQHRSIRSRFIEFFLCIIKTH